jgi:transposase-like protein
MSKDRSTPVNDETILRAMVKVSANGGTIADVATETGMKLASLNQRVQTLRKGGLELPTLKRRPTSGEKRKKDFGSLQMLLTNIKDESQAQS